MVYFESITEEVADFDGGTHYLKATAGVLAATGWATPTIYVDGVATTTVTTGWHHIAATSATAFTCTNLQLGTDNTGFGAVRIADVCLWGRALSAAEVLQEYNGTTWDYDLSEVSRWDMSNINPPDVGWKNSGNNGTGTCLVASTDIVPCPYGGYATEFNGTNEFATVADSPSLKPGANDFSVSVLMALNAIPADTRAVCGKRVSTLGWDIRFIGSGAPRFLVQDSGGPKVAACASAFVVSVWGHVVCTKSGLKIGVTLNGSGLGTQTLVGDGNVSNSDVFEVGRSGIAPSLALNCRVDDLRIYSSALTAIQAADLNFRLTRGR